VAQNYKQETYPVQREFIDLENALPNQQPKNVDCSFTETNKFDYLRSDSGQLAPVYYIRGNAAFRVPLSGTEVVGELPIF
jgi:hypothetical protein